MKKSELIIVGLFFCILITGGISWAAIARGGREGGDSSQKKENDVKGVTDLGNYPKVLNIAPNLAPVDKVYTFSPKVVISKGDLGDIKFELVDSPDWLFIESNQLFGIPGIKDIGDSKVVVRIWNGAIYSDFIFYVKVYEENVSGN